MTVNARTYQIIHQNDINIRIQKYRTFVDKDTVNYARNIKKK